MKKLFIRKKSPFRCTPTDPGQSIEEKVRKARTENAPIDAISPMIYTDAKNGVQPELDIRTDRQEIALDAIDHYQGSDIAKGDGLNIDTDKDLKEFVEPKTNE